MPATDTGRFTPDEQVALTRLLLQTNRRDALVVRDLALGLTKAEAAERQGISVWRVRDARDWDRLLCGWCPPTHARPWMWTAAPVISGASTCARSCASIAPEKYASYAQQFESTGLDAKCGVELVYAGLGSTTLVADDGQVFDTVLLVRYPSRRHFVDMVRDPSYLQFEHLRTEALSAAVLQATTQLSLNGPGRRWSPDHLTSSERETS